MSFGAFAIFNSLVSRILAGRRVKWTKNWLLVVTTWCIQGTLAVKSSKSF